MQEIIAGTLEAGISVDVLLRKWRHGGPIARDGLCKVLLPYSSLPLSHPFLKYAVYPLERSLSYRSVQIEKPAVFHSSYYTNLPKAAIPQIITVHDFIHEKGLLGSSLKTSMFIRQKERAMKKADGLISISDTTARDIAEYYQIDKRKIHTIHLGTSDIFYKKKTQEELQIFKNERRLFRPYILYVGNRGAYKNFYFFVSAFARWKYAKDFSLAMVGGGNPTSQEVARIRSLGLQDAAHWFRFVDDEALACFYQGASAFVFPSLYEGFGLPLLEAMASDTPVFASDIPVFREIGGGAPHYFDPEREESLIESMTEWYETSPQSDKGKGIKRAMCFTRQAMVNTTVQLYKKMAQ